MRETFWCEPRVENVGTQEHFLLLVGPEPGAQSGTERCLESMHRGFGEGSAAIIFGALPVRFAYAADAYDGAISFKRAGFEAQDRARSWWGDQTQLAPARGNITAAPVTGAVADDFPGGGKVGSSQEGIEGLRESKPDRG
jgi:hypothetical protein